MASSNQSSSVLLRVALGVAIALEPAIAVAQGTVPSASTTTSTMSTAFLTPAIVGSATAILVLLIKEWLFGIRRHRLLAIRMLSHCSKTLAESLGRDPAIVDYPSVSLLEPYTAVYVSDDELNAAFDVFLDCYLLWRAGAYKSSTGLELSKEKEKLAAARKSLVRY